ncbi:MAG: hypothetical protein OEY11_08830 [Gammaproteobacteria bacterium]|nr:hypothetical protein [Gammaproteobacteria bacterium]
MNKISEQQKLVSDAYQLSKTDEGALAPMAATDAFIQQAAAQAIACDKVKRNSLLLPLSAAASVLIVAGIVLKMAVFTNDAAVNGAVVVNKKQPMYMLQRSKTVPEEMLLQIKTLLEQNETDQARSLYKKFHHRYPLYEIDSDLREKLQ